jgi:hypothetical protein
MQDLFRAWVSNSAKLSPSGWYSYNAVCCHHRGHRADTKKRGGVKYENNGFAYHCFNCNFSAGWQPGQLLSNNLRNWLRWSGADQDTVLKINFALLRNRDQLSAELQPLIKKFEDRPLSSSFMSLGDSRAVEEHYDLTAPYYEYLLNRQLSDKIDRFYVDLAQQGPLKNRIILPFTLEDKNIGYTARTISDQKPKYYNYSQSGYVFNIDAVKAFFKYCLVFEGVIDAVQFDGVAVMGNEVHKDQHMLINRLGKNVVVVPDQDQAGLKLIDSALEHGYAVSFPNWGSGIKDANDAVIKYGKLFTLVSILENIETQPAKIEIKSRLMKNNV